MTGETRLIEDIRAALAPHGLFLRGTVNFDRDGEGPVLAGGRAARAVVLIGNQGGSLWEPFSRWRKENAASLHPLDDWSKSVIRPLAKRSGAAVFFPSDPPYQPFQQWAMRAEGLKPSPLGILIHPQYGLWHGYRAALAFAKAMPATGHPAGQHLCEDCAGKPCLSSCPAGAVLPGGFDPGRCRGHLSAPQGAECMQTGCLARSACPIGASYRYSPEQLVFHMNALIR